MAKRPFKGSKGQPSISSFFNLSSKCTRVEGTDFNGSRVADEGDLNNYLESEIHSLENFSNIIEINGETTNQNQLNEAPSFSRTVETNQTEEHADELIASFGKRLSLVDEDEDMDDEDPEVDAAFKKKDVGAILKMKEKNKSINDKVLLDFLNNYWQLPQRNKNAMPKSLRLGTGKTSYLNLSYLKDGFVYSDLVEGILCRYCVLYNTSNMAGGNSLKIFVKKGFNVSKDLDVTDPLELMKKAEYYELPTVAIIFKILSTIGTNSATAERVFSALKLTKTKLRNSMGEERLDALMSIYYNSNIECDEESVVTEFAKRDRQIRLK